MTLQQSLDLAEMKADLADEKFFDAFETEEHPEILEQLNTEATIARHRYFDVLNAEMVR